LEPIRSIRTWVFAFQDAGTYQEQKNGMVVTGLNYEEQERLYYTTQLVNLYSPLNKNKYAIASIKHGGYTPEFEALHGTVEMLNKFARKESKKIIVMMTDGSPYSNRFYDREQRRLIRDKVKELEKKGVIVIHLALTSEAENTPYNNKVKWDSKLGYDGLVTGFIKMLKKSAFIAVIA
jgi:uncharacterized protein YegL